MTQFTDQLIAQSRFGLGARADQIIWSSKPTQKQLQQKLVASIEKQPVIEFPAWLPNSNEIGKAYADLVKTRNDLKKETNRAAQNKALTSKQIAEEEQKLTQLQTSYKAKKTYFEQSYFQQSGYIIKQSVRSEDSLNWRLFDFFSNHFSVSSEGGMMKALAVTLETEAIAPNLNRCFEDMLIAVSQHPAMLMYLNNEKSFGPNSQMGLKRKKKLGLNENLAREILELHTLGVEAEYTQFDVIELAKAITGWSLTNPKNSSNFEYLFRHEGHEPGSRNVLGRRYPSSREQGVKILKDLANHPSTANHVCRKLVQHFLSDTANEALVENLTRTWITSKGDLKAIMKTLIQSEQMWHSERIKFKSPREFLISSLRLLDSTEIVKNNKAASTHKLNKLKNKLIVGWLQQLGQRPFSAGSPAGYPDSESDWNGATALMARIDWINLLASKARVDIDKAITLVFGDDQSSDNYLRILRAESKQQALTLLLLSPEFMRR